MIDDEYARLLLDAYRGELFGEAFFATLADTEGDGERRRKLRTMELIEAQTAARLRPLVDAAGIDPGDEEAARGDGFRLARDVSGQDWDGFMHGLKAALPGFLANFERLREIAGDPVDPALDDLVAHEQTLYRFTELELDGRSEDSLSTLLAQLDGEHRARVAALD
jgi:hypothetical protein